MKKPGVRWPLGPPCTTWPVLEFGPLWLHLNHRDRHRCLRCKRCRRRCLRCPGWVQHHLGYLMGICQEKQSRGGGGGERKQVSSRKNNWTSGQMWGAMTPELGLGDNRSRMPTSGKPKGIPHYGTDSPNLRVGSESPA